MWLTWVGPWLGFCITVCSGCSSPEFCDLSVRCYLVLVLCPVIDFEMNRILSGSHCLGLPHGGVLIGSAKHPGHCLREKMNMWCTVLFQNTPKQVVSQLKHVSLYLTEVMLSYLAHWSSVPDGVLAAKCMSSGMCANEWACQQSAMGWRLPWATPAGHHRQCSELLQVTSVGSRPGDGHQESHACLWLNQVLWTSEGCHLRGPAVNLDKSKKLDF